MEEYKTPFKDLLPKLSVEEYNGLMKSISEEEAEALAVNFLTERGYIIAKSIDEMITLIKKDYVVIPLQELESFKEGIIKEHGSKKQLLKVNHMKNWNLNQSQVCEVVHAGVEYLDDTFTLDELADLLCGFKALSKDVITNYLSNSTEVFQRNGVYVKVK